MQKEKEIPWLRYGMYVLMGFLGVSITMVGPMLDVIIREYHASLSQGGMLTGALSFGGLFSIILMGVLSDRMSKKKIVIASFYLFGGAMLIMCLAPSFLFLLVFSAIMGIGSKAFDALSNAVIKDAYPEKSGAYLNLMHTYVGLGAIAGPILSGSLLGRGISWKIIFIGFGLICLILNSLFTWIIHTQKADSTHVDTKKTTGQQQSFKTLLCDRRIWLMCVVIFFYVGHQSGVSTWTPIYFQKEFGFSESLSGFALAIYWLGIVISRLICVKFYRVERAKKLLTWGGLLGCTVLLCGVLFSNPLLLAVALLLTGVFTGGVISILLDVAYSFHPEMSGAVTSLLYGCMNIAPFFFPVIMGVLSERYSIRVGFYMTVATLLFMLAAILLMKPTPKKES